MKKKIRVAVLYGGKSGEHEVSLQSGASVIRNLDKDKFEVIPVSIDKNGHWQFNDLGLLEKHKGKELPIFKNSPQMMLMPQNGGKAMLAPVSADASSMKDIDVVFPVMHGPLCEDGSVQGLLEMADVAYVGSGVLGSAVGMDKDVAKRLAEAAGIPIVPYLCLRKGHYLKNPKASIEGMRGKLKLPLFVKPANLGSSVGVHKVKKWEELAGALEDAFLYDQKVLVEQAVNAREIEIAVLENADDTEDPIVSVPGEIVPAGGHEFYSYDAKYLDENGAMLKLPAELSSEQIKTAQTLAGKIFHCLECSGMARVDLFLDKDSGEFYFNEVNTIPGFTSISMYPKMMERSGIPYKELLTRLIETAIAQHERKKALKRDFS